MKILIRFNNINEKSEINLSTCSTSDFQYHLKSQVHLDSDLSSAIEIK